jgi:hypothetical protein
MKELRSASIDRSDSPNLRAAFTKPIGRRLQPISAAESRAHAGKKAAEVTGAGTSLRSSELGWSQRFDLIDVDERKEPPARKHRILIVDTNHYGLLADSCGIGIKDVVGSPVREVQADWYKWPYF